MPVYQYLTAAPLSFSPLTVTGRHSPLTSSLHSALISVSIAGKTAADTVADNCLRVHACVILGTLLAHIMILTGRPWGVSGLDLREMPPASCSTDVGWERRSGDVSCNRQARQGLQLADAAMSSRLLLSLSYFSPFFSYTLPFTPRLPFFYSSFVSYSLFHSYSPFFYSLFFSYSPYFFFSFFSPSFSPCSLLNPVKDTRLSLLPVPVAHIRSWLAWPK